MDHGDQNYGRKGGCFGKFVLYFFLFIIMLVWIYYKNNNSL